MPHMLFLHFNLNLKADNIHSVCAQTKRWWPFVFVEKEKKISSRRKRRKEVFFQFDWRCLGLLLFLFGNLATTVFLGVIFGFYHLYVRAVYARLRFGFSFYLRCFPVSLSRVCVALRSCLHFAARMPLPFFLFVFDRDNAVHSENSTEKIRNAQHFDISSFIPSR